VGGGGRKKKHTGRGKRKRGEEREWGGGLLRRGVGSKKTPGDLRGEAKRKEKGTRLRKKKTSG